MRIADVGSDITVKQIGGDCGRIQHEQLFGFRQFVCWLCCHKWSIEMLEEITKIKKVNE